MRDKPVSWSILHNTSMTEKQPNNLLHGIALEQVVTRLEKRYGWDYLARNININCFKSNPSVKSSLKFLRQTPWARERLKVCSSPPLATRPHPRSRRPALGPKDLPTWRLESRHNHPEKGLARQSKNLSRNCINQFLLENEFLHLARRIARYTFEYI